VGCQPAYIGKKVFVLFLVLGALFFVLESWHSCRSHISESDNGIDNGMRLNYKEQRTKNQVQIKVQIKEQINDQNQSPKTVIMWIDKAGARGVKVDHILDLKCIAI
jgi:hypothetical protein